MSERRVLQTKNKTGEVDVLIRKKRMIVPTTNIEKEDYILNQPKKIKQRNKPNNMMGYIENTRVPVESRGKGLATKLRKKTIKHFIKNKVPTSASLTIHPATEHMNRKYGAKTLDPDTEEDKWWSWHNHDYLANMKLAEEGSKFWLRSTGKKITGEKGKGKKLGIRMKKTKGRGREGLKRGVKVKSK